MVLPPPRDVPANGVSCPASPPPRGFLDHHQTPHVGQDDFFQLGLFDGRGIHTPVSDVPRGAFHTVSDLPLI